MYHHVAPVPADAKLPGLYVAPQAFVAQLRYLQTQGYEAVTLQQVYDFWQGNGTLPQRPIVLDFDDGSLTDFLLVAPLLKGLHWPGVLNLIVGRKLPESFARMPVSYVRALVAAGWEIDSHTIDHVDLAQLSGAALAFQLVESRAEVRKVLGVPANFFCYPAGAYNAQTIAAVHAARYLAATTEHSGYATPPDLYALDRIRVAGGEGLAAIANLPFFQHLPSGLSAGGM